MTDKKLCESCGMPLQNQKDFGGGRLDNKYCIHCTDAEGNLKPYEQVFAGMKQFTVKNMGVSDSEAEKIVQKGMSMQPAWQGIKN